MKFGSFEEAVCAAFRAETDSDEWREAMHYAITHAPPEYKEMFDDAFRQCFPDLKPAYYDADGNPYFTREQMKEHFGVTDEEIDEVAAKHPDVRADARNMTRVQ